MHRCVPPLAALLAAAALGCASPVGPGPADAGATRLLGRSCSVDGECGGLRCDVVRQQCVCGSDFDCLEVHPEGDLPFCDNYTGRCVARVAGCMADSDCPAASFCDQETRACRARRAFCEECTSDLECGADADHCVADAALQRSFCGLGCARDGDCPAGATCQTFSGRRQCWPKAGTNCRVFAGCTPDSKVACSTAADCVGDQTCDAGSGVCVARVRVCPFGQLCDPLRRVCVDRCLTDSDCLPLGPTMRCVGQTCEPVGECAATASDPTGDKGCPANRVCSFSTGVTVGTCVPFCGTDQDCPPGSICVATADQRRKCQIGCRVHSDCPVDRTCVKAGGSTVGICQGKSGVTCQSEVACGACQVCDLTSFTCVAQSRASDGYCRVCGTDAECGAGHCLTLAGGLTRCGQPCPSTGCPRGFACSEICVGGYQGFECSGALFAECVPTDLSCSSLTEEKCAP